MNADTVRIRSRHVKRFNTTSFTKIVLCLTRTKPVVAEVLCTLKEMKTLLGDNQMLVVVNIAYRAVAGICLQVSGGLYLPLNITAVASPFVGGEL
jgi:hypothetical protein